MKVLAIFVGLLCLAGCSSSDRPVKAASLKDASQRNPAPDFSLRDIDGKAVRSCIAIIADINGKPITTIEGLEKNGKLHPVQDAFLQQDAMQCGFCTTGMIMSGVALLAQKPRPTRDDIRRGMEGNICRCGTQPRIVLAIEMAARLGGGR